MKKNLTLSVSCLLLAGSFLLSGCASIVSKSSYPLSINTNPSGAQILITNKKGQDVYKGQSPATVVLKSSNGFFSGARYQVTLSYPGYEDQVIPVTSKLDNWYWGNILFGGLIGMLIVDPATGAMYKLENTVINTTLDKQNTTAEADPKHELNIIHIDDLPENMKEHLVRLN